MQGPDEKDVDPEVLEWLQQVIMKEEYYDISEVDLEDLSDDTERSV